MAGQERRNGSIRYGKLPFLLKSKSSYACSYRRSRNGQAGYGHLGRASSPSTSVLTASEFGDPDHRGRSMHVGRAMTAKARDALSSSFNGLLIMVPGIARLTGVAPRPPDVDDASMPPRYHNGSVMEGDDSIYSDDFGDLDKRRSKRKRCRSLFLLLAIDFFTIALVLVLFSYMQDYNCISEMTFRKIDIITSLIYSTDCPTREILNRDIPVENVRRTFLPPEMQVGYNKSYPQDSDKTPRSLDGNSRSGDGDGGGGGEAPESVNLGSGGSSTTPRSTTTTSSLESGESVSKLATFLLQRQLNPDLLK